MSMDVLTTVADADTACLHVELLCVIKSYRWGHVVGRYILGICFPSDNIVMCTAFPFGSRVESVFLRSADGSLSLASTAPVDVEWYFNSRIHTLCASKSTRIHE
jgi:hypothetical protein